MLIDAHIHYTPPSLKADLDAFIQEEPFWGLMLAPAAGGKSVQGWATAERMIEDMDAAGIDKVMLMGEYRRTHDGCVRRNDQALEIIRCWPDRVIAFAMIQPKAGQAALDELKRCLDGGMRGVGELGPYGQGYRLDDPDFLRLVEACIRHDVPLNLHTNEEMGHYYPGKATTPLRDYYWLASRYPELKLILAHWGGGLFFYELMPEVRRVLSNVWYDTAASPLLYPTRDIFDVPLRCIDHTKLLYASDYPLQLYPRRLPPRLPAATDDPSGGLPVPRPRDQHGPATPRDLGAGEPLVNDNWPAGQPEPDFRPFLAEIEGLGIAPDIQADILGENAARLLGLAEAKPRAVAAPTTQVRRPARAVMEVSRAPGASIAATMSTVAVAEAWPETRAIFARYGIPYEDSPVPFWEPINQAAAARGLGPDALARLVAELNEAIGSSTNTTPPTQTDRGGLTG